MERIPLVEQRLLVNHALLFMSAAIKPVQDVRNLVFAPDPTEDRRPLPVPADLLVRQET